jgi:hypothetical protein
MCVIGMILLAWLTNYTRADEIRQVFQKWLFFLPVSLLGNFLQTYSHLALIETTIDFFGGSSEENDVMNLIK